MVRPSASGALRRLFFEIDVELFMRAYMDPRFERLPDQLPINRAVHPEWAVASFLRHGFVFALRRAAAIERASTIYVQHRIIAPKLFKIQQIRWRRGESNDTRLLILRNLLQTYERKNRTTRCMPASYVQNHVQKFEGRVSRRPLNAGLRSSPFRISSRRQRFVRQVHATRVGPAACVQRNAALRIPRAWFSSV